MPAFVFVTDTRGRNTFTNRRFQRAAGLPAEALLGEGWLRALHPGDRARAAEVWGRAVDTGAPYEAEYQFLHAGQGEDGGDAWRWMLVRGAPERDPGTGRILRWVGTCTDVEALRASEAARREGEARPRLATAAGGVGVWDWDAARDRVDWSGALHHAAAAGLDPSRLHPGAAGFLRAVHPADRGRVRAAFEAALAPGGPPFEAEFRVPGADGAVRWLAGRGEVAARDPASGRALRVLGTTIDVTARREAEGALRAAKAGLEARVADRTRALAESEARFRAWFEAAEDAVFVVRADPDGRFVHEAFNPAAERLTGIPAAALVGRQIDEVAPAEAAAGILARFR